MDAYVYKAALWCGACAAEIKAGLMLDCATCGGHHAKIDYLDCRGIDQETGEPKHETLYDSDDYPKGPFLDGGGESDYPQHCDGCGVFLENPLTDIGYSYVRDLVAEVEHDKVGMGPRGAIEQWRSFYL